MAPEAPETLAADGGLVLLYAYCTVKPPKEGSDDPLEVIVTGTAVEEPVVEVIGVPVSD
jgi:hypothetical protein